MAQQFDSKEDYINWLSTQTWRVIADEAESVGFEKEDDQKWSETVDAIAALKFPESEVELPVVEEKIAEPLEVLNFEYRKVGVVYKCPVCNEQLRTGETNELICPIKKPECPRS